MSEDRNTSPVKNNGATPDMSPLKDDTNVPLTNNEGVKVEEAKFKKNEAAIDLGIPKSFSGLTKEELMKYSNDPFWIRLRMFLFVLFWLVWLAMLVLAVVIIVKAPACTPPPERVWVEEQAIVSLDPTNLPAAEKLLPEMEAIGVLSAYFPDLISLADFKESKYDASSLIDSIVKNEKQVVTDFPASMDMSNPFYQNASDASLISDDGTWNYTNPALPSAMMNYFLNYWVGVGVKGFLILDAGEPMAADKATFKEELNELLKDQTASVGSNFVDFESVQSDFSASDLNSFLEMNSPVWSYYRFAAEVPLMSRMSQEDERLTTIALFLYGGTPMLTHFDSLEKPSEKLIAKLSEMRSMQGIKLGEVIMANSTDQVVAFTRIYKGTPAYAIALNFNDANETVSFAGTPHLNAESTIGTVEIDSQKPGNYYDTKEKLELTNLTLKPLQGLVIQFVANF